MSEDESQTIQIEQDDEKNENPKEFFLNLTREEEDKLQFQLNTFLNRRFIYHDDWIYFSRARDFVRIGGMPYKGELYRIRSDGTNLEKLSEDCAMNLQIIGDYLYYSNESDFHRPYRIKLDGTEREKLSDVRMTEFYIEDDWVFFSGLYLFPLDEDVGEPPIHYFGRMRIDGTGHEIIYPGDMLYLMRAGEYIYGYALDLKTGLYKERILSYPIEELKKLKLSEDLKPIEVDIKLGSYSKIDATKIGEKIPLVGKVPYAILDDGTIFNINHISETYTIDNKIKKYKVDNPEKSKWIARNGAEPERIVFLNWEDKFFSIENGKVYTSRYVGESTTLSNSDKTRNKDMALIEIDEKGEKELFREYGFSNSYMQSFVMLRDNIYYYSGEEVKNYNLNTKELKTILPKYQFIALEEAREARKILDDIESIIEKYDNLGYVNYEKGEIKHPLWLIKKPDEGEKYPPFRLEMCGVFGNKDYQFYPVLELIKLSPEEMVSEKMYMTDIESLYIYFKYFDEIYNKYLNQKR